MRYLRGTFAVRIGVVTLCFDLIFQEKTALFRLRWEWCKTPQVGTTSWGLFIYICTVFLESLFEVPVRQGAAGAVPAGLQESQAIFVPSRDNLRHGDRRCISNDSHQVFLIELYLQGNYVRTLADGFSAVSAAEFVLCYNRLGAHTGRSAEIAVCEVEMH